MVSSASKKANKQNFQNIFQPTFLSYYTKNGFGPFLLGFVLNLVYCLEQNLLYSVYEITKIHRCTKFNHNANLSEICDVCILKCFAFFNHLNTACRLINPHDIINHAVYL